MRLIDLEPEWCCRADPTPSNLGHTDNFAEAQGIWFLCPVCFAKNNGPVGTHMVLVWFADRGVPAQMEPTPRWRIASGDSFANLTLQPSIDTTKNKAGAVVRPDEWHGYITNGQIT